MTINDSAISEQGMCEEEQVARIAWFYYHDGLTQSEISDRLGLTRLKVSRLLVGWSCFEVPILSRE